jgi:hypothetical protein
MSDTFVKLTRAFEAQSPVDIDGTPFAVWLMEIREPEIPSSSAVDVVFGAKSHTATHIGELQLGREPLQDEAFVLEHAIEAIRKIVRAQLPPGTREVTSRNDRRRDSGERRERSAKLSQVQSRQPCSAPGGDDSVTRFLGAWRARKTRTPALAGESSMLFGKRLHARAHPRRSLAEPLGTPV